MAARKIHDGKTTQGAIIEVCLCPDEGRTELETQLQELAKGIVSSLSTLELSQSKELLGAFVSELFLSVAEQERREYRRKKQAEGISEARAQGVRFGRQPKPLPDHFDECYEAWRNGQMTATQAAETCGISRTAFYRAIARMKQTEDCSV